MQKVNEYNIGGEVVKDNETYLLKDNRTLKNLVLSSTRLYRDKALVDTDMQDKKKCISLCKAGGK